MGNNSSSREEAGSGKHGRHRLRPRRKPHHHGGDSSSSSSSHTHMKNLTLEQLYGIARIEIRRAEMHYEDKWFASLSIGERAFKTVLSNHTNKPVWNSVKKVALERNGAHIVRISVFETKMLSKSSLVGYCEIDLLDVFNHDSYHEFEVLDLLDPSSPTKIVGSISLSYDIEEPSETERSFVNRLLKIVDYNEDGQLSFAEFSDLVNAFGNSVAKRKVRELFNLADSNGDGVVSIEELTDLLAAEQEM